MSVRDDLLAIFNAGGCNDPRFTFEEVADRILNTHAHELAEQQRAYAREVGVPLEDGNIVSAGDVIDLIDPHAGLVRPDGEPS